MYTHKYRRRPAPSDLQAEHHAEKLLVVYGDDAVHVRVELPERGRQRLLAADNVAHMESNGESRAHLTHCGRDTHIQNDAALDEVVEQNRAATVAIELAQQQADQIVGQPIAERRQRGLQLRLVDVARVVGVERPEAVLPVGHVLPQGAKVREADGAAVLLVEHADHQAHRFRIEGGPGAVGQGDLQLVGGDEAAVVLVDAAEWWRGRI